MTRADDLRIEILALVERYYDEAFGGGEGAPRRALAAPGTDPDSFVPGSSRVPYGGRVFGAAEIVGLVDAALDFWLTAGRYSARFERELAALLGVRRCLLVNSGSSANLLAFMALTSPRLGERRVMPGDEVITVAAGFPTTVAPIVQYGAVPVFVDVDPATANVDATLLPAALGSRSKAVFLAHTLGNPFDVAAVRAFCDEHELWLIEDNCDALGSRYGGRLTGTFGDLATSSFYPPHHVTMGEGGAVYTSSAELGSIVASLRDWGRDCVCPPGVDDSCGRRFSHHLGELPYGYDHKYVYSHFGYNLRPTDLQAAVGCAQLARLDEFTERRRANHARLIAALEPFADLLVLPRATPGSEPSWFGCLLTLTAAARHDGIVRDRLVGHLEAAGVQTRMLFAGNIVRQPCFDGLRASGAGYRVASSLENTDRLMTDALWVGVYPGLTDEMVDHIAGAIADGLRGAGA